MGGRSHGRFLRCISAVAAAAGCGQLIFGDGPKGSGNLIPFTEEAVSRGLIYEVQPWNGPTQQGQGFGVAIVDLNGNGHQDIIVMGRGDGRIGIFENTGGGTFVDRSVQEMEEGDVAPILVLPKASGIAVADYNGDGLLDVYITQQLYEPNALLHNNGGFSFTNLAAKAGVDNTGYGEAAAWGDYDSDGWLDLYVVNYTYPVFQTHPDRVNQLYRNLGDGTFMSVGAALGVADIGVGYSATWSDINRNGKLDLHLANDRGHLPPLFHPNQLWRNDGGTFTNLCPDSGACLGLWSMCMAAGDATGNGYPDFYITNLSNVGGYNGWNPLLINQGDETFIEDCTGAGVCQFITSWCGIFFDFDNNGWLDLYVCNQGSPNRLYANAGSFPLADVSQPAGVIGSAGFSFNAAVGDVTGNGALDLLLNNYGEYLGEPANVQLFINHEAAQRNWARFNVVGLHGNRHAIGANIDLRTGDQQRWREIYSGGNTFKAQNELVFHFGLAEATIIDEIVVQWPGGSPIRVLTNYPANVVWNIYPPELLGDCNGDGVIDLLDLRTLLYKWGPVSPGAEILDMNGDGAIDVLDLLALLDRWGAR
jgi:enediyne biosynthesis protein E4